MPAKRDPVSEWFDAGARDLLARAYAHPGAWAATRLANPEPRHLARAAAMGIGLLGKDDVPAGGLNARTRWARGFVRALYYQHKWFSDGETGFRDQKRTEPRHSSALEVEVGRAVRKLGVIPAGRAVRIRVQAGGRAANRAARAEPRSKRIYTDDRKAGARWADPARRDWAAM